MKMTDSIIACFIMSAMLFGAGCIQREAIVKDTFLLDVQRQGTPAAAASEGTLSVRPFSVAPAFQGKGFVYRTGENRYESDYYNEYFVSPPQMIAEQTRNWLSGSGLFAQVLPPLSSAESTHILEGHIRRIAADGWDGDHPKAVLEISFFLLEQHKKGRTIRFQQTYSAERPLREKTAAAYIDALNQCLRKILQNLETDLETQAFKP